MRSDNTNLINLMVQDVAVGAYQDNYYPVRLITGFGHIDCRYYSVSDTKRCALWIGGIGGNWDTPAQGLYPHLCQELQDHAIASLRVRYRYPADLRESTLDVLSGIGYLQNQGIEAIALIGHSFGGAVAIQAAAQAEAVCTVIAIATQYTGTNPVSDLTSRCSLMLLHGAADPVLSALCSQRVYDTANEPKRLIFYPHARHNLDEVAEEVHNTVRDWLLEQLH